MFWNSKNLNKYLQNCSKLFNSPTYNCQTPPSKGVLRKKCYENMQQIYRRTLMPKCDFNKIAEQLYWNHTSTWVLSFKFAAYFRNTFSYEHLWRAVPELNWRLTPIQTLLVSVTRVFKIVGSKEVVRIACLPCRTSQQKYYLKKGALKNFVKFAGKHLCQALFLNKVAGLRLDASNFIKKETLAQVFSCEFCEIFKNTYFTEHLRMTASGGGMWWNHFVVKYREKLCKSVKSFA